MSVGYPSRSDEDEILSRRIERKKDAVEVETITGSGACSCNAASNRRCM